MSGKEKNNKRNSQSATSPPLSRRPASPEALANINKFMESIGEDLLHHSTTTIENDDRSSSSDDRPINQTRINARANENTFDEQQFDEMINKKSCRDNSYDSGVTLSEEDGDEELHLDEFDIARTE
uniref:Uncharacterized protein n=1 Tax=Romanomermis culicivorax TaxID=13658 RepID=A0A915JBB1_ROMCU